MSRSSSPSPFLHLLSAVLLLLPLSANAQFDITSPQCCRTCYDSVLGMVNDGSMPGLTTGDTVGRCNLAVFETALTDCWASACSAADAQTGIDTWNKTCIFSASTSSRYAYAQSLGSAAETARFARVVRAVPTATAAAR